MQSTHLPLLGEDEAGAVAILGEIVHVQREYMRDGDPQRMWDELLAALMRTTASRGGFIGEVVWGERGIPSLNTRSMVWAGEAGHDVSLHPDVGLLVSRIIAEQAPVIVDLGQARAGGRRGPIGQFLGLPLISSDRLVGVVGLASPAERYGTHWVGRLQPLLSACASIVESLQTAADRRHLLGELERTAGFLQAVINASSHGILVVDPEGCIETANPAAHDLLDSPLGALIGRTVRDFAPGDDRRQRVMLERMLRQGAPAHAAPITTSITGFDGIPRSVELSVGDMVLDGERRLVLMFTDISERLQAQAALARAAEIIDATPDLIVWADPACRLVYMNEGGRRMMGVGPSAELEGMTVLSLVAPEQGPMEDALVAARRDGVWRGELAFKAAGAAGPVPVSVVIIADAAYVAVLARDLTERFEIELLKESFVANVSHELRTPLTAVIGYLELLGEGILGELNEAQAEAVGVMSRNGDRLLDLIGDILLIGSLDSGSALIKRPVDLPAVVGHVLATLDPIRAKQAIKVDSVCDRAGVVMGDESELKTVVSNIIGNALKFTPHGGQVTVSVSCDDRGVVLEVVDTGLGIAPEEMEFVFDRFYRGDDARKSEVQGAGLGLAIAKGVVQRHGGTVDISSAIGAGTTVTVALPPGEEGSV